MSENEVWKDFWDHVEDLRSTLLKVFGIIGIGFILILFFYQPLFNALTSNFDKNNLSVSRYERIMNVSTTYQNYKLPLEAIILNTEDLSWVGPNQLRLAPSHSVEYTIPLTQRLLILSPLEGIILTLKLSFWASLVFTSPLWSWFLLQFILPGLKKNERIMLIPLICWSFLWMGFGFALAYFFTIPLTNNYLEGFNASIGQNAWTLAFYIDYTLILLLGHAFAFEIGLILLCLVHYQCLSPAWLISKRRIMIFTAFILAALLTPPDVPTQMILALLLVGLYELAILYGKCLEPVQNHPDHRY
ncbi:MAG: twin-arginine translocase subunit TatC [Candidatus Protochlamydia sp.]|nr:twin-arginine translocase subunit TatC [Candidatus Protochlamydia sp.]